MKIKGIALLIALIFPGFSFSYDLGDYLRDEMNREYTGWFSPTPYRSTSEIKRDLGGIMKAAAGCGHARQRYFSEGTESRKGENYCEDVEDFKGEFFPRLKLSDRSLITEEVVSMLYRFFGYDMMD